MKTKIISFVLLSLIATFAVVSAPSAQTVRADTVSRYGGLVQCDGVTSGQVGEVKCDFAALIKQVNFLINWMFGIAIPVAIALFAYAGYLYMTGTPGNVSKAKGVFTTVGTGFILMLIAWFVIYTLLSWLTKDNQGFTSLLK